MSTVQQIESAIARLSRDELSSFRSWFSDFDATTWDRQFDNDAAGGRLDAMADEALRDLEDGRRTDLRDIAPTRNSGAHMNSFP